MPYKTKHGTHYHKRCGCHGATIPCDTTGLSPCSDCCAIDGSHDSACKEGNSRTASGSNELLRIDFDWDVEDSDGYISDASTRCDATITSTDLQDTSKLKELLATFDIDAMIQAPMSPDTDDILQSIPFVMQVMQDINNVLSEEYGDVKQRSHQFRNIDVNDTTQWHSLVSVVEKTLQSLLDSYGITPLRPKRWKEILRNPIVVDNLDEWRQLFFPEKDSNYLDDEVLLRDVAKFTGNGIGINKAGMQVNHSAFFILRVIFHENLHNVAMEPLQGSLTDTSTGLYQSVADGALDSDAWRELNEGMTEVLSRLATESVVGAIPDEVWIRDSGHPIAYLICHAITQSTGIDMAIRSYMGAENRTFSQALFKQTQGKLYAVDIINAIDNYTKKCKVYYDLWQMREQSAHQNDTLLDLSQSLEVASRKLDDAQSEIQAIFDILTQYSNCSRDIRRTARHFRMWQRQFKAHPTI